MRLTDEMKEREAGKELFRDSVLAESGLVLFEAKAPQPHCQVHDSALVGSITSSTLSGALSIE
jgi:hypothetical protein